MTSNMKEVAIVGKPITIQYCEMFGGIEGEGQNALMTALYIASGGDTNDKIYPFLRDTPKTSLVVELHDALRLAGFKIIRSK